MNEPKKLNICLSFLFLLFHSCSAPYGFYEMCMYKNNNLQSLFGRLLELVQQEICQEAMMNLPTHARVVKQVPSGFKQNASNMANNSEYLRYVNT
jgi:hypothetical protein